MLNPFETFLQTNGCETKSQVIITFIHLMFFQNIVFVKKKKWNVGTTVW